MCFLRFLMQARSTLSRYVPERTTTDSARKLHLVIGNESCDLDSAVSAVTLAFIYAQRQQEHDYVPVLNIPRIDYPLKTEVGHMFNKCDINEEMLLFRDDLPNQLASDIDVILVDHHISQLAANVSEILDHRPLEQNAVMQLLPAHCVRQIEPEIGSCATLVGERYLAEEQPRSSRVTQLLHATILLDTINFSSAAKRFCPSDLLMVDQLEQMQQHSDDSSEEGNIRRRQQLFDELVTARADISKLSLTEVLRKDMKQLQTERHTVPIAGLPMLARDFIEKSDAELAIRQFAAGSNLLVILGMLVPPQTGGGQVQRDVALISLTGQRQLVERVRLALLESQSPPLQLHPHEVETNFLGGCYLRQHNVQATRKHILPIIKQVLVDLEASHLCDCDDVYFFKEKPKLGLS
ncbi:exopolyphosphatase PRUNE1 [Drosophila grimshawi]|uniref:GH17810 n=1 Tax=Drosophila grimshawi TaxID=7222 RepID=B4JWS0_DROGR|nr:exopolyphosphatase PRUNE1 [Drosophila grimshawi]EDV95196.1 GH17810 [Drosophila grimshawi]